MCEYFERRVLGGRGRSQSAVQVSGNETQRPVYVRARINFTELQCHYNLGFEGVKYNWFPRATLDLQHDTYKALGD